MAALLKDGLAPDRKSNFSGLNVCLYTQSPSLHQDWAADAVFLRQHQADYEPRQDGSDDIYRLVLKQEADGFNQYFVRVVTFARMRFGQRKASELRY